MPLVPVVVVERCVTTDAVDGLLVPLVPVVLVDRCVTTEAVEELLVARLPSCLSGTFFTVVRREQTDEDVDVLLASIVSRHSRLSCSSSENPSLYN